GRPRRPRSARSRGVREHGRVVQPPARRRARAVNAHDTSPRKRPLPLRIAGFFLFLGYFLRALVLANLQLARTVLFTKRQDLTPGFLTYPVEGLSRLEILLLSHCITLPPGTTTVEISPDFTRLTLH